MFDLIGGLPVHVLVLHVYVVLGPIAALATLVYLFRPVWRRVLRWPVGVLAVVAGVSGLVTKESGEQLAHRLVPDLESASTRASGDPHVQAVLDHAQSGDLAGAVGLVFMVATLIAVVWAVRDQSDSIFGGLMTSTVVTLVAISSVALVGSVFFAGHSGVTAAWGNVIAATATPGGN
ncbi:hypothetical protein GA0111570_10458 [Raineyella antarctica]|uniref:DUF2231 domain-containing protein n=1 Tax=Raineyella antarctica TaxID=1577474 RepID=A0A1G6GLL9_9ACTN|nr:DUF2231 domain-containing protein [Raineyella antarctica]SDB82867.1 hypothetical protein GA0111570_10458 [Raineyella antarctica]